MRDATIQIDPQLWKQFASLATQRRKRPQTLLAQLMRDYLQIESDGALFKEMQHDAQGRALSDAEAVTFVHQHRRAKRQAKVTRRSV